MYRALIICGDDGLRRKVRAFLVDIGLIGEIEDLDHTPNEVEFSRLLRLKPPHLVFVGISSLDSAKSLFENLEQNAPGATTIALSAVIDQRTVKQLMQMGAQSFIPVPIQKTLFSEEVRRLLDATVDLPINRTRVPHMFSFLPGKGGSGTSVLACHFSAALARELGPDVQRNKIGRALLVDLDTSGGISRYLFRNTDAYTLAELVESGVKLDGTYWPRFIRRVDALDIILAGRVNPRRPLLPADLRPVFEYARDHYSVMCVDLTGNWEGYAVEVLRQSACIFLVCSTDLCSLRLAAERMRYLEQFDLAKQVGVLVNRFPDRLSINTARIQDEIGAPVLAEFDYGDRKVQEALANGNLIDPDSSTGRQIRKAAQKLCWEPVQRSMALAMR